MNKTAILIKERGIDPNYGPICPHCGAVSILCDSARVYGRSYGNIWLCRNYPTCDTYIGVHKHGPYENCPLGILANQELRKAKIFAHEKFDLLWKYNFMKRDKAYLWLQKQMKLKAPECHIGEMNIQQCQQVRKLAEDYLDAMYKDELFPNLPEEEIF